MTEDFGRGSRVRFSCAVPPSNESAAAVCVRPGGPKRNARARPLRRPARSVRTEMSFDLGRSSGLPRRPHTRIAGNRRSSREAAQQLAHQEKTEPQKVALLDRLVSQRRG